MTYKRKDHKTEEMDTRNETYTEIECFSQSEKETVRQRQRQKEREEREGT